MASSMSQFMIGLSRSASTRTQVSRNPGVTEPRCHGTRCVDKKVTMNNRKPEDHANPSTQNAHSTRFEESVHLTAQQVEQAAHLSRGWRDGPLAHLARLSIPEPSAEHGFRFAANGRLIGNLLLARVYCDSLAGVSGNDTEEDPVVAHLVTSGRLVYTSRGVSHTAAPGRLLIRDARTTWTFTCAPATRAYAVTMPRPWVLSHMRSSKALATPYVSDVTAPEVRLLVNFLETIEKSSGDLDHSVAAQEITKDVCASLLSGILANRRTTAAPDHSDVTVKAAKAVIEKNLSRQDLSPAMISRLVGVSLRTLHRSFSESDDSVMTFIRRRRLQEAHDELLRQGATANVSEIAARWRFADASHFIRHFKSLYGATPTAYLRSSPTAGEEH